ncbi:hypothetical protein BJ170DRAFT_683666 [Xylariales sp. AK1849]|nr:hypothetical protein BJ170DRAFT_683666 [Xylariales sp. AK1849]
MLTPLTNPTNHLESAVEFGGKLADHSGRVVYIDHASETAPSADRNLSTRSVSSYTSSGTLEYRGHDAFYPPLRPPPFANDAQTRAKSLISRLVKIQQNAAAAKTSYSAVPSTMLPTDTSRSTSSTSSHEDLASLDTDRHLIESMRHHWEKLREQRLDIRHIFDKIRQRQSELQDLRLAKDKADRQLFLAIRQELYKTNPVALEQQLVASEKAALICQDAGASLDELIDDLDDAELDLEIIEKIFYSKLARGNLPSPSSHEDDHNDEESHLPSRTSLRGISRDRPEDLHPLYEEMREAFRDLRLAKEYLHNLAFKRLAMESKEPNRLPQDASDFLADFDDTASRAKADVDHWSHEFERLHSECREKGLIPRDTLFHEDSQALVGDDISLEAAAVEQDSPTSHPTTLSHPAYPVLLANPTHVLNDPFPLTSKGALKVALALPTNLATRAKSIKDAMQEHAINILLHDANPQDKNDYINRWLLQKLQLSPMEVDVLYSTFRTILRILDVDRWQRDVLKFWSRDEAVKSPDFEDEAVDPDSCDVLRHAYTPSDKRAETRSDPRSRAVSEPPDLHHVGSWDECDDIRKSGSMFPIYQQPTDLTTKFMLEHDMG